MHLGADRSGDLRVMLIVDLDGEGGDVVLAGVHLVVNVREVKIHLAYCAGELCGGGGEAEMAGVPVNREEVFTVSVNVAADQEAAGWIVAEHVNRADVAVRVL